MKHNIKYIILLIFVFVTASCVNVIDDFELQQHKPQIVINGLAQPDSTFSFFIGKTSMRNNFNDNWYEVTASEVSLTQNGSAVDLTYVPDSDLYLAKNSTIKPNDRLEISVKVNGLESVSSQLSVPDSTSFEIRDYEVKKEDYYNDYSYPGSEVYSYKYYYVDLSVFIDDDKSVENFYAVTIERGDYEFEYEYPEGKEEAYIVDSTFMYRPVEITSQDGIYEFYKDYNLSVNADLTQEIGGSTLFFKDALLAGLNNTLSLKIEDFGRELQSLEYRITISSYTEDMFLYLRSLASYNTYYDFPFSEPVYIYTNIENGRGVFGAVSKTRRTIMIDTN